MPHSFRESTHRKRITFTLKEYFGLGVLPWSNLSLMRKLGEVSSFFLLPGLFPRW